MNQVTIEEAVLQAESANKKGESWHFHLLSPACRFNSNALKHALIVENCSRKEAFAAYCDERPTEVGKKLVQLLHGSKILGGTGSTRRVLNPQAAVIVARAAQLNRLGIAWHHHMLFPDCALNGQKGNWNLTFEDPESGFVTEALYESEPVDDLREVEALFYAQAK